MKIETKTHNKLLKRHEVSAVLESQGNPGFAKAATSVAELTKATEDRIVVKNVSSRFGRNTFTIDALVYDSVEDKARIEPKIRVSAKKEGAA